MRCALANIPAAAGSVNASSRCALLRCAPVRALVLALAVAAVACDPGGLILGGARRFDEVDVADAARQIGSRDVWLVQVRQVDSGDPRAPGADIFSPDQPLPEVARAEGRAIFVVGHDDAAARRFASRLVRGGFERVVVVRGGIQVWRERGVEPERNATVRNG